MRRYDDEEQGGRINGVKQKKLLESALKKKRAETRQLKGYEAPREEHSYTEGAYSTSDY